MKLINHIIFTNIDNNKKLMINSLNGLTDKVDKSTYETMTKWKQYDEITPNDEKETALFENLKSRGYLVNNNNEEIAIKEKILEQLRQSHAKNKSNNKHITFVMTYDCNFRCPYCFEGIAGSSNVGGVDGAYDAARNITSCSKTAVMTPDQIDAAFDLVGDDLQSIGLFGGEPLLPKNRDALEYIITKAPNKTYSITTNGYFLEEFFEMLSKINISGIMVTLDGEEETHNSRRFLANGKPTYKKIVAGIKMCLENNIPICVRMNLDNSNFTEGNKLKAKLLKQLSPYGDLLSFEISPMMEASMYEKNTLLTELYNSDADFNYEDRKQRNRLLSTFSPIINVVTVGAKLRPVYSFCSAHDNGYFVDPYGNIYPCLVAVGKDDLSIGTYYPKVEFKENSIRNRNIDKISECRECIYSLLCGGGCAVALSDYSNVFKPVCFNIKNQIHDLLPAFFNATQKSESSVKQQTRSVNI